MQSTTRASYWRAVCSIFPTGTQAVSNRGSCFPHGIGREHDFVVEKGPRQSNYCSWLWEGANEAKGEETEMHGACAEGGEDPRITIKELRKRGTGIWETENQCQGYGKIKLKQCYITDLGDAVCHLTLSLPLVYTVCVVSNALSHRDNLSIHLSIYH